MKYHLITFGCQMNKSDSERIAAILKKNGHGQAAKINDADLIVVNMCSVRQSAVDRVFGLTPKFKKLRAKKPNLKTILTGCILKKDRFRFINEFDDILKFKDLLKYQPQYQNKSLAYIPISNGCNNLCSYCVVPYTRGPLICRDHQEILKEVKNVLKKKFREIWLLGQNVNDYQSPSGPAINFAKLLEKICDIPGDFKVFFLSPNPKNFSDELIEVLAKCRKFGKLLNLPIQSGDNKVLKKMNRPYNVNQYKQLVEEIRNKIPDINLSTDVIVGFPGETKKQFENTCKLFKEIKFNTAYIAKYSPRQGTTAFKMKDNIPLQEKKRRERVLIEILKERGSLKRASPKCSTKS